MPKTGQKEWKVHGQKPYTKVTAKSLNRFKYFHSEDKTNLTNTYRNPDQYSEELGFENPSLKELIIKRAKETGRKIKILDAGCGQAYSIDGLLSDKELENSIESISGISLHYFNHVKDVMKNHGKRFIYYSGTAQSVLSKAVETNSAFDFILDVWGAYRYSEDKYDLLKQYHQALKPGGQAFILMGNSKDLSIKSEKGKESDFMTWTCANYPETFSRSKRIINGFIDNIITMTKSTARLLFPEHEILSSRQKSSITTTHTKQELKNGNALKFTDVIVKTDPSHTRELRPLSYGIKI